jgi:hypothetical protein
MATYSFIILLLSALGLILGRALTSKRRRPPPESREPPGPKGDLTAIPSSSSLLADMFRSTMDWPCPRHSQRESLDEVCRVGGPVWANLSANYDG